GAARAARLRCRRQRHPRQDQGLRRRHPHDQLGLGARRLRGLPRLGLLRCQPQPGRRPRPAHHGRGRRADVPRGDRRRARRRHHRRDPLRRRLQEALRRRGEPGEQARRLRDGTRDPLIRPELRHRGHRNLRARVRRVRVRRLRRRAGRRARRPRPADGPARRTRRGRHRRVARRTDRLRHQPRPRPRPAHRTRDPADQGQGLERLGLLVGSRRRPPRRRRARGRRRSPAARTRSVTAPQTIAPHSQENHVMGEYILAIDQGTTSSRAIIFDKKGSIVSVGQKEHEQIFPRPGWVEHDATEIWHNVQEVIGLALSRADLTRHHIEAIGITNQRETAVVWDKNTGEPVYHAIVWQDTRTQDIVDRLAADGGTDRLQDIVGLPLATYFAGTKIAWILENVEGARERAERGDLIFGTTDTWVLWNLTGGPEDGVHVTDVTNASRTLFMDLETLEWRDDILETFGVPRSMMPEIRSSSEVYGHAEDSSLLRETPIAGILGDQQAATFGQAAFAAGESKNTYGTGNFLIFQTGEEKILSKNGLLTTIGYKLGDEPVQYALEGSIAVTGSLIQWLRDQLGIIRSAPEVEELAKGVDHHGGVYFVPAVSGPDA